MTLNKEIVFSMRENIIIIQSLWKCIKMCKVLFLIILILEVNVFRENTPFAYLSSIHI